MVVSQNWIFASLFSLYSRPLLLRHFHQKILHNHHHHNFILPTPLLPSLCFLLLPVFKILNKLEELVCLGYLQKGSLFSFNSPFIYRVPGLPAPPDRLSPDRSSCDQAKSSSAFSLLILPYPTSSQPPSVRNVITGTSTIKIFPLFTRRFANQLLHSIALPNKNPNFGLGYS